jgi:hypothetical protein
MSITLDGSNASTVGIINSATAKNSTSGTAIDFTGIPSGVKRITVMLTAVSTNAGSTLLVQVGSGSVSTTGYTSQSWGGAANSGVITTGLIIATSTSSTIYAMSGLVTLCLIGSNVWVSSSSMTYTNVASVGYVASGYSPALSGALDRIRITTGNGTDTFDAGTINILYE